jgi:hypothetical protein
VGRQSRFERDYRATGAVRTRMTGAAEYDPLLGWRLKAGFASETLNAIEHGVRKNSPGDDRIRTGGLLAVGDSFTAGSEVSDHESWSAFLERRLGIPVINGASGGYGTESCVSSRCCRSCALQPYWSECCVKTSLARDIRSIRPKPYYTIQKGELVLHNSSVPLEPPEIAPTHGAVTRPVCAPGRRGDTAVSPL